MHKQECAEVVCITVFICSTRIVLLILFYHLMIFEQPRYGDIGTVGFGIDVHSNFLMPYRQTQNSRHLPAAEAYSAQKNPGWSFLYFYCSL